MGTTLVVGATGKAGTQIVTQLREKGRAVRAMTRDPARANHLSALGAEVVQGDLTDRASLERACAGIDSVVASAHAALGRGANSPQTVDRQGHRDLIEVARAEGVKHFVYVSAQGIGPDHPVDFFRIKHETEQFLEGSGLSYSIVRGSAFMETMNEYTGDTFLKNGRIMVFGRGDMKGNHVSVRDVARFVVLAEEDERLRNRRIDVGGPENLTQLEIAEIYQRVTGRKAKITRLPVPVLRTARVVVGAFVPAARRILGMGVLIATKDASHDMSETLREFPMELTRFEDVVQEWFAAKSAAAAAG